LTVQGFKSFVGQTKLKLVPGVVCIVGPNGSGKSNIVDAIRWVLGEQSARNIRGSKMEQVIFHGTQQKKQVGFAEVCLTIDNSEGMLPIQFDTISVSRRIYRSGESEFSVNKNTCRLKDIYELFLDTGIGRDGYSIIGQGKVDEIISSKPEDRRSIFEEATGIMKYKRRRDEAQKKIDTTMKNIERLNDIMNEMSIQITSLSQQTEVAQKYMKLKESLKCIEIGLYALDICKLEQEFNKSNDLCITLEKQIDDIKTQLSKDTYENQQVMEKLKQIEEERSAKQETLSQIETNIEKLNSIMDINLAKKDNFAKNISDIEQEQQELIILNQQLARQYLDKEKQIQDLRTRKLQQEVLIKEQEAKVQDTECQIEKRKQTVYQLKQEHLEKIELQADKKILINKLSAHVSSISKRVDDIDKEMSTITEEIEIEKNQESALNQFIVQLNKAIKEAELDYEDLTLQQTQAQQELEAQKQINEEKSTQLNFKISRCAALKEIEQNLEGYSKSVKMILKDCAKNGKPERGIHGALAQLIKMDVRYETAIEVALGSAVQNIVTSTPQDAKQAIEYLKKNGFGRATFLPLLTIKGRRFDDKTVQALQGHKGFCGVASDLVECLPEYRNVILSLLGKVAVVKDMNEGIKVAHAFGYSFKIVTLEGEILNAGGSMSGGSLGSKTNRVLGRARQISELDNDIDALKKEMQEVQQAISERDLKLGSLISKKADFEQVLSEKALEKIKTESNLNNIAQTIKRLDAKRDMLLREREQLVIQEQAVGQEICQCKEAFKTVETRVNQIAIHMKEDECKYAELLSMKDAFTREYMESRINVEALCADLRSVKASIDHMKAEQTSIQNRNQKGDQQKKQYIQQIEQIELHNKQIVSQIQSDTKEKEKLKLELDEITKERISKEELISSYVARMDKANKAFSELQNRYNYVNASKIKSEADKNTIELRLIEEYNITYVNAKEYQQGIKDIVSAKNDVKKFKEAIKELGMVNLAAIEEHAKIKGRYDFMELQREDMYLTCSKLKRMLSDITGVMRKRFMEQFKFINEYFNQVFVELFGGGSASLILTNENDVLESGIEIQAKPPGKKLQNMMLLSGGERALTAIALLFAVLKLRPSPFCVLDEIEATLDDANVYRFMEYIKRYANNTQFIVITHRKGTMEAADVLYGVTMQERGVSSIASLKLEEEVI